MAASLRYEPSGTMKTLVCVEVRQARGDGDRMVTVHSYLSRVIHSSKEGGKLSPSSPSQAEIAHGKA